MNEEAFKQAIRWAMSPQAVALTIAHIQSASCTKDEHATLEVAWLVRVLTELVGGAEAVNALYNEIGV